MRGPSHEVLAIRDFFEWVAAELEECDHLTPEETRIGLDLDIAHRRGVDPKALKARLESAIRAMDAEDLLAIRRKQGAV